MKCFTKLSLALNLVAIVSTIAAALPDSNLEQSAISAASNCSASSIPFTKRYTGVKHSKGTEARLRIGNGGAGQSGLVGALASAFIDWSLDNGVATADYAVRNIFDFCLTWNTQ
jgi:hypothetical protein